ncbi:YcaO-like family protein [Guyparkeria hydrothermalis]|uniref:30S ribosomal protein S12 methylthiotransferase accessory protein YcaO n=1 Tax=Guyparkeria halophila TaxID=47960 RepID=A0A6I6CWH0_9GAMM|nr:MULTISPECIES: YcaO-like family protein [Guyparkeria]MCL7752109.1 YcaO-like family protein [Guyparkeria hydrothermalis]QGT78469.1 30S ribosomal protein S12 methylthiotransferase accessory protein YcaO [Guyparkeria halophila]TKA91306.1 30S ribosomal protein S12 methylthiotransferase accessory protein YcaO [Guyparkeria sp. SB14A]
MTETLIPGKDAPLEDTIARVQGRLSDLGFEIEPSLWRNPLPNCWSVHIKDRGCPALFTNGKGATREAALASALGEFVERLASQYFFADFHWHQELASVDGRTLHDPAERWFTLGAPGERPEGLLDDRLWSFYGGDALETTADWADLNSGEGDRICALPFVRQRDGATIFFPVNVVGNLYVSNGLSAGNTLAETHTQGLSEVFERSVKEQIITEGIALPEIPDEVMARFPASRAALEALNESGFAARAFDASLGGRFPVICVLLYDPETGGVFASFGAHPRFDVALERTLTELVQGRDLDDLHAFPAPTADQELAADPDNIELHFIDSSGILPWQMLRDEPDYPFTPWGMEPEDVAEMTRHEKNVEYEKALIATFHELGHDVYIADFEHLGLPACRILVPGVSEIYPVEELIERNNNQGLALLPYFQRLDRLTPEESREFAAAIAELALDPLTPVSDVIGLCAGPDSVWAGTRIGEVEVLARLHAHAIEPRESDEIGMDIDWLASVPPLPAARQQRYRAAQVLWQLESEAGLSSEATRRSLEALFPGKRVDEASRVLAGQWGYHPLTPLEPGFRNEPRHAALIDAYRRAYQAKLDLAATRPPN